MGIVIRPFEQCVEAFRASNPDAELNEQQGQHYTDPQAYSFEDLSEWPSDPPLTSLYLMKDPPTDHSATVLTDPKSFVDYCNFGGAVGVWNANGSGRWAHEDGTWIIADLELWDQAAEDEYAEDVDAVGVIFALWRVEEGFACAVWRPEERSTLAEVMGFDAWASAEWQPCDVWYGE